MKSYSAKLQKIIKALEAEDVTAPDFIEIPEDAICTHLEHIPPSVVHYEKLNTVYRHVCPKCGAVKVVVNPELMVEH